jgi:quinol monooxygenase YgiN
MLFQVSKDRDNQNIVRIYEEYRGQQHVDIHNSTDRFRDLNAKIEHMLSEVIVRTTDLLS